MLPKFFEDGKASGNPFIPPARLPSFNSFMSGHPIFEDGVVYFINTFSLYNYMFQYYQWKTVKPYA